MEKSSKKLLGLALAGVSTLVATSALAAPSVDVHVHGLAQMDFASYQGDSDLGSGKWTNEYQSGGDFRRARVALNGDLDELWSFQLRWDFVNEQLDDSWLAFSGCDPVMFKLGRMNMPSGMEFMTRRGDRTFMEAHDTLVAGDGFGLMASGSNDMMAYQVGAFLPEVRSISNTTANLSTSDQVTWAGRVTFAPSSDEDMVHHFGASYYTGKVDRTLGRGLVRSTGPMINVRNNNTIPAAGTIYNFVSANGGAANEIESQRGWGLEAATEMGPWLAQAEYMKLDNEGSGAVQDSDFHEWYGQVSYVMTGESRPYNAATGTFGRVSPSSNMGAWEVALRYGHTDLSDNATGYTQNTTQGDMKDWTLGVNWYATDNVTFRFNYVKAEADYTAASGLADRDLNIFGLRAQFDF